MQYNFDEYIDRSGTNTVKYDLRKARFGREDVIPMWVADMDFKTPDFVAHAVQERAKHEIYGYTIRPKTFYSSIVNWVEKRYDWKIKPSWIQYSPGVVPALAIAVLAFTQPGDKIVVQPPVYYPFFNTIKNNGRQIINNPLKTINGKHRMDFDDLRKKIDSRTKMLFLCSPHNPGGRVWTKSELKELSEIALKHNLLVVADEIHADLVFKPNKHTPLASISNEIAQQCITCIAPSKTFNLAGMSTAAIIIQNKKLYNNFHNMLDNLHLFIGNTFGGVALEAAYKNGEQWLNQLLEYVNGNIDLVMHFFKENLPLIKPMRPEGTYLVWIDFNNTNLDNESLKKVMIEKAKVGMNDGSAFGEGGNGFQRMNVACPRKTVQQALERIEKAFQNLKK